LLLDEKKCICARAEWHVGGQGYCASCVALDRPRANDNPAPMAIALPYLEHEPLTEVDPDFGTGGLIGAGSAPSW
jgi:hypothetical protein